MDRARVPVYRQQRGAVRHPPRAHLARPGPRHEPGAIATQYHGDRKTEGLGQHRLRQVGAGQRGVLRLDARQIGLPKCQVRKIQLAQVAAHQPKQVDDVARPIALVCVRPIAPAVEQR
jgi:hypothetical protein